MKKEAKIKKAFEVLELAEGASKSQIIKAYRKLSLKGHPDRFGKRGHLAKTKEEAEETFKKVSQAKMILLGEEEVDDDDDDIINDYLEKWRKMTIDYLTKLLKVYEISRSEYEKIIRENIMESYYLKKHYEKFIDFENQLKKLFSTEEISNYSDKCAKTINAVYSLKMKKEKEETDKILENLKREKGEQDKGEKNYFSDDNDKGGEQEQEKTNKFEEKLKEEKNESYDEGKVKFNDRSKQEYIEKVKSELLEKEVSDERLNQELGVSDWKEEINKCADGSLAADKRSSFNRLIGKMEKEFICESCGKKYNDYARTSYYDKKEKKSKFCSSDCVNQGEKDNKLRVSNGENLTYPQKTGVSTFIAATFIGLIVYIVYRNSKDRKARERY